MEGVYHSPFGLPKEEFQFLPLSCYTPLKMQTPLLTVIIPTRNRRALLEVAIRSALPALSFPHEILVSDNASTDSTEEIAALFPQVRYQKRNDLLPMAEHWNLCVSEAKGKYIKLLCDDDWLYTGALEREVGLLESNPSLSAVASSRREVSPDEKIVLGEKGLLQDKTLDATELYWRMLLHENLPGPPSAVTFRKSCFRGFPAHYDYAADWAAWILLAQKGPVAFLAEPGCAFRLHGENLTDRHVEAGTDFVEVMALRQECLSRLTGFRKIAGQIFYKVIFYYRLKRRIARLVLKGKNPLPFLKRAYRESRSALR